MTQGQKLILVALAIALLVLATVVVLLFLWQPSAPPPAVAPLATVPPNPQLVSRIPLCHQVVERVLADRGWQADAALDPGRVLLEIRLAIEAGSEADELPAGQIWDAFEAALAGRSEGCAGYTRLVVEAGGYRVVVAMDDLIAWQDGQLDDGALSDRVTISR